MSIIINITDEQKEEESIIGVLGNVVIVHGKCYSYESFEFYMMEDIECPYNWLMYIYPDKDSKPIEIDFFPKDFYECDYLNRNIMKWLVLNAEDIVRECQVRELLTTGIRRLST